MIGHVFVLTFLLGNSNFFIETLGICHDYGSIKQGHLYIKALLLLCEHGHFLLNFDSHGLS